MSKPKHKRCLVCNGVTSRYSHTQNAGAFNVIVWVRDAVRGEVSRVNGTQVWCKAHAPAAPVSAAALPCPTRPTPPTRDYALTGHAHWRTCGCGYHRQQQAAASYDGPLPDSDHLYDPET